MEEHIVSLFCDVAEAVRKAGTDNPFEVAESEGIVHDFCYGTMVGFATHYGPVGAFSVNKRLEHTMMFRFTGWHEIAHIIGEDVFQPGNERLYDKEIFTHEVKSLYISQQERTANLVAANMVISDDDVYEATNYYSETMKDYRRLRAYYMKLSDAFNQMRFSYRPQSAYGKAKLNEMKDQLRKTKRAIADLETDVMQCCHYKTFAEIAAALGISERILRYKLEAMRLCGLDIDSQELEHYDKMFKGVI